MSLQWIGLHLSAWGWWGMGRTGDGSKVLDLGPVALIWSAPQRPDIGWCVDREPFGCMDVHVERGA